MSADTESLGDSGFTLIELLVSMTLLSLLMMILFSGLHFGVRAWDHSDRHLKGVESIRFAQTLIRNDIEETYPLLDLQNVLHASIPFHGNEQSLAMLVSTAQGQMQVRLSVEKKNGLFKLIRNAQLNFGGAPSGETKTLLSGVEDLKLRYFGVQRLGAPREWSDSWNGASRLPELVEMTVIFPKDDARQWPELFVAPRLGADVNCRYDLLTKYCAGR